MEVNGEMVGDTLGVEVNGEMVGDTLTDAVWMWMAMWLVTHLV